MDGLLSPEKEYEYFAEELARRRAKESLEGFRAFMAATGSGEFANPPAAHHRLIMRQLERLEAGDIRRLMILAPPGSAKSTYGSIQFPLWYLARHPNQTILACSNTEGLAQGFNRRRRNLALTHQWQAISGTKLASDLQGVEHFGTEKEGGIKAAGVGSAIVGTRSHVNVLDDPIASQEDALSATTLDKQWDWYLSEYRLRLVPKGRELIISTRWARRDIAGRILELIGSGQEKGWYVLRLPMICDEQPDALGRQIGESLWPDYFTAEFIAEKMRDELIWQTQFQQTPLDEAGTWVGPEHLHAEEIAPESLHYVIAVDLALSVSKGDYTAIVVAGLDEQRHLHIVQVLRDRLSPEVTVERLATLCDIYRPQEVLIDDDNASKVLVRLMLEIARTQKRALPPINPQPMRGRDKETRAAAIRGLLLSGHVHILQAPWTRALQRELLEFPAGDHDDQVDALGLIGRRFPMLSAPSPVDRTVDPYAGQMIRKGPDGKFYYQATLDQMFRDRERVRH